MKRVYWDTNCFVSFLKGDEVGQQLAGVVELQKNGELEIITSAITITELLKLDGSPDERTKIIEAFSNDNGIIVVELTKYLAEKSRDFIWKHNFEKHKFDAIHLATAIFYNEYQSLDAIHSFDNDILKFSSDPDIPILIEMPTLERYPDPTKALRDIGGTSQ